MRGTTLSILTLGGTVGSVEWSEATPCSQSLHRRAHALTCVPKPELFDAEHQQTHHHIAAAFVVLGEE